MQFGVLWEDGFQARDYDADLANSQPFKTFVESRKELFPLRFSVKESKQKIKEVRRQAVSTVTTGSKGYISLRYFDGTDRGWYDSLNLPMKVKTYVAPFTCEKVTAGRAVISIPLFDMIIKIDNYDIISHVYDQWNPDTMVLVEPGMRALHPNIWQ
jgi:hypothetical protein